MSFEEQSEQCNVVMFLGASKLPFSPDRLLMPYINTCTRKSKMKILEFGIMPIVLFVFLQKPGYCYCNK